MGSLTRRVCVLSGLLALATFIQPMSAYEQQVRALGAALADRLATSGKKTVAVVDFTDLDGNVTWLGRFLAEEVSVALAMSAKGFEVVERTQLKAILKEHKLAASGIIDSQTARRMGQVVGVDVIITGTVTEVGESVRLTAKALDAESARMVSAQTADIPMTKAIGDLAARGVADGRGATATINDGSVSPAVVPSSRIVTQTAAAGGVDFELMGCRAGGGLLQCDLMGRAQDDLDLSMSQGKAFDESGNEIRLSSVQVGNRGGSGRTLVAGIRTRLRLTFGSSEAGSGFGRSGRSSERSFPIPTRLSLLSLTFMVSEPGRKASLQSFLSGGYEIEFREVAVGR